MNWRTKWNSNFLFAFVAVTIGVAPPPAAPSLSLTPATPSSLPTSSSEGDLGALQTAIKNQIARCATQDLTETFNFGGRKLTRADWCIHANEKLLELAQTAKSFAELELAARDQFEWYQSVGEDGHGKMLFTGYYAPTYEASATPTAEFSVPVYRKPADLVQVGVGGDELRWMKKNPDGTYTKFEDREAIDVDGALKGQGLEIAYLSDWFSATQLQVQGSGFLHMTGPKGDKNQFIDYAAENGRRYISVSQILEKQGIPPSELTIPGIEAYFAAHPDQVLPVLSQNPSYVFFRIADDGPYGAEGVILTPRHSVAIDPQAIPMGAVALLQTTRPEMNGNEIADWKDFSTLVITQDVGGAIQGPGRVDFYWGSDTYAAQAAGVMCQPGSFFVGVLPSQ